MGNPRDSRGPAHIGLDIRGSTRRRLCAVASPGVIARAPAPSPEQKIASPPSPPASCENPVADLVVVLDHALGDPRPGVFRGAAHAGLAHLVA
jgi:hypothetical protein